MDASWPIEQAQVPAHLPADRAWRWCVVRTVRDMRIARRRGHWLSRQTAERLFCRRWGRWRSVESVERYVAREQVGRRLAGRAHQREVGMSAPAK